MMKVTSIISLFILWNAQASTLARSFAGELTSNVNDINEKVESAFTLATEGGHDLIQAQKQLEALPADQVIPAIVRELQGLAAQRGDLRVLAYTILAHHHAENTGIGYGQLIAGLGDPTPSVQRICCDALGKDTMSRMLEPMHAQLINPSVSKLDKDNILRKIAGWGVYAQPSLEAVSSIFVDKESGEHLRWAAAQAILSVGGLDYALEHFKNLDHTAEKVVMWSLAKYLGLTNKKYHYKYPKTYRQQRSKALTLVLQVLQSDNKESRLAAAQVLFSAYGMDFVIFHSPNKYEWNQKLRDALRTLSHDPDPKLREAALRRLEVDIDTYAKRILRRKRRIEKMLSQENQ